MKRFPLEQFATVELNQVAFPKTGAVVSQTPLGAEFTKDAPCENGMWVLADKARGYIGSITANDKAPIGVVYTTEKEYDFYHYGLKTFGRKIAGDYPRVGVLAPNDTITSNCFQYDDEVEFKATTGDEAKTSDEVLFDALNNIAAVPMYVVPVVGSAVPKLTKSKPQSGMYAKVVKFYTVPNGEKGIKYQVISL